MNANLQASLSVEDLSPQFLPDHSQSGPAYRDAGFVLSVVFMMAMALFAVAFVFRHKLRRRPLPGERHAAVALRRASASGGHRRRRRRARPRNPSRAEVGGLPPRRSAAAPFDPANL